MAELKRLKVIRIQAKGQITRINNFLSSGEITQEQVQTRIERLQELWALFNETQAEIKTIKIKEDNQIEQVIQEEQGERINFEENYYKALDKARSINFVIQAQAGAPQNERENGCTEHLSRIDIKLPTLKLPVFAGEYEEWMLFKDTFLSLIHENSKLTDVQKFQYLRSVLKDEALQVVSGLNTSASNYQIAWELLKQNYENKKLIINTHVAKLLEFPSVTKDKHVALRQFAMHIRTHMKALQVLGEPVDNWNTIIIYLARHKLDYYLQREWEEETRQQEPNRMPMMDQFLEFLQERCRTMEMLDQGKHKTETVNKGYVKRGDKRVALAATAQVCAMCKGTHYLYGCPEFLGLAVPDRIVIATKHKLCLNCLRTGHFVKNCKSSNCRKCAEAYNTLLHVEPAGSSVKGI